MRVVLLMGNHPRHFFIRRKILESGRLAGCVVEDKGEFVPAPPEGLSASLRTLFVRHFEQRAHAEAAFFGAVLHDRSVPELHTTRDEINSLGVREFIAGLRPDLVLSYGTGKLDPAVLGQARAWNLHAGLSPWYRGSITHFWPSYMLEPQMTGMTLHEITPQLDAGPVIHQSAAPLVRGDGLHELSCRALNSFSEEMPRLLGMLGGGALQPARPQAETGKLWRKQDWRPEHLRLIYETFEDRIVDAALDGRLSGRKATLVRQFEDPACAVSSRS